ncbi:MAG: PilZ domain-containing protein [Desulfobacteraceae bacterium]|nr:PilZ domain-containing protein [Desulfobacteraceae bacterium]
MFQSAKTDATSEKRRAPRIDAINTVEYVLYDAKKTKTGHGRAFTVNLSQTGTLVQTRNKIDGAFIILMTIDLDGSKLKVSGKIINSRSCEKTKTYFTGIEFIGPKDKQIKAVVAFVKAYQRKKHTDEISFDALS